MSTSSCADYSVKPTLNSREGCEPIKRKHQLYASAELNFRDRSASIHWVANRMGESERAAELRAYADELDQMADQMERATKPAVSTLEATDRQ